MLNNWNFKFYILKENHFAEWNIKRSDLLETIKLEEMIENEPNEVIEFNIKHFNFSNFVQNKSKSKLRIGDNLGFNLHLKRNL